MDTNNNLDLINHLLNYNVMQVILKYKKGDTVFFMEGNRIKSGKIKDFKAHSLNKGYQTGHSWDDDYNRIEIYYNIEGHSTFMNQSEFHPSMAHIIKTLEDNFKQNH